MKQLDNGFKLIIALVLLMLVISSIACLGRVNSTAAQAQQAQTSSVNDNANSQAPQVKQYFTCGALTKKGLPCKNHVKQAGLRCHLHQGK